MVSKSIVSFVLLFDFKTFFGEHSTQLPQAWILEPKHLPKERKEGQVSTQYHGRGETYNLTN
jgi:hypothetical protein